MNPEPKFFLYSRTILSAPLMVLPKILAAFGIEFSDADADRIFDALTTLLGFAGVVWGRTTATRPIEFRTGASKLPLIGVLLALSLAGCTMPKVNAKIGYTYGGKSIIYDSGSNTINLEGSYAAEHSLGGGKAYIELK